MCDDSVATTTPFTRMLFALNRIDQADCENKSQSRRNSTFSFLWNSDPGSTVPWDEEVDEDDDEEEEDEEEEDEEDDEDEEGDKMGSDGTD